MQESEGIETARLLPPAGTNAPFGLHVVLDVPGTDPGRSPFVRLSEADDLARVYLAAVKGDDGTLIELCALKLVPDAWPEGVAPGALDLTNRDLEERWERERSRLVGLNAQSPHFPRLVRLDDPAGETGDRLPPLLFSRVERSFFVPPCPACKSPLSLCRDEAWLAHTGLPSYASSRERFVWCESCAQGHGAPTVYSTSKITTPGAIVRSAGDLLDDLQRALREVLTEEEAAALVGPQTAKAARADRANVRDLFTPLTFYGSPFLVTVAAPLDLESLADALGGRPWEEFEVRLARAGGALPARWAWLVKAPPPNRRLLFAQESSGLDAVEIFFLKLTAFRQILDGLVDYYRAAGRPHLDLHPRHLLFELSGAGDGLPLLWTFQVRIHGLAAAALALKAPGNPSVVLPGHGIGVPYASSEIQEFRLAGYRPCELVFTDLEEDSAGSRRFHVRGRVSDAYGLYPAPQPRDTIFLSVPDPALDFGFTGLSVRAVPGEIRSGEAVFTSELVALEENGLRRLRMALGTKIPGARYRVFPDFGTPSDLHALGVSLLRLLLRNDGQDVATVVRTAERLSREISGLAPGESRRGVTLSALLKRVPDAAGVFSKTQIFWSQDDRRAGRPNAVPETLWERALLLALRLVTRAAGFSVAATPADFDPLFREEKLERIIPEVVSLLAELQTLLFERQSVHLEIQQVLAEIQESERSSEARR